MGLLGLIASGKRTFPHRRCVEVRFESIGGQGGHTAGKILAEAAVMGCNFTGHHFSSYGSEKRGTPVQSHVRFYSDGTLVRSANPVKEPDILVICHESLLVHHPKCLEGVTEKTDVLINSTHLPQFKRLPEGFRCRQLATVAATQIAFKEKSMVNAVMLGALSSLIPEIPRRILRDTLSSYFNRLSVEQQNSNLRSFDKGLRDCTVTDFRNRQARDHLEALDHLPDMGWQNAAFGGVILSPGNSVLKDNSSSRKGLIPRLDGEACISCGFCDMVCPDYCFSWGRDAALDEPLLLGIDYQYCKGCGKCVEVCPVDALTQVVEKPHVLLDFKVSRFPRDLILKNEEENG